MKLGKKPSKPQGRITFIQHTTRWPNLPLRDGNIDEFSIGDFAPRSGSVHRGGEFKIVLRDHRKVGGDISPQIQVFGDGMGSLLALLDEGGECGLARVMHGLGYKPEPSFGRYRHVEVEPDLSIFPERLKAIGIDEYKRV